MSTSDEQIKGARELCEVLKTDPSIKEAYVDDWGRYGNFTVHVVPRQADRHVTTRMKRWLAQSLAKTGIAAHVRNIYPPINVVRKNEDGRPRVVGYFRPIWTVDLDFQVYDRASNTFA